MRRRKSRVWRAVAAAFAAVACAGPGCGQELLTVAAPGASSGYAIVLPSVPSASQTYAAEELRKFTRQMTGVTLSVVTGAVEVATKGRVELGLSAEPALGDDGFRIRTSPNRIEIVGSPVRGTLYGVYELLEKFGGCRWYAHWHEVIPTGRPFVVPAGLDYAEKPAFACRELFYSGTFNDQNDFAARLRLNARVHNPLARHGGNPWRYVRGLGNCHTFERLVPWKVYGREHPEYFSLRDGKRPSMPPDADAQHKTQLCLTNPDVLRIVVSNVLEAIRRDPEARFVGISQNDNEKYCQCPECAKIDAEEGSPSGTNIRFANAVAEAVERVRPDMIVETLAYNHTRHLPKLTRPRRNVMPCLCSVECDFSRSFRRSDARANKDFLGDIRGWSRVTDKLYVWDYVTDFGFFPHLFPNVYELQDNVRLFRDNHVIDLLEQGATKGLHSGFGELRIWLLAKLMWNPDAPVDALVDDFFRGYYGRGASRVREVFDEAHRLNRSYYAGSTNRVMSAFQRPWDDDCRGALPDAFLERSSGLLRDAEAAVEGEPPVYGHNVRMTRLGVEAMRAARMLDDIRNIDNAKGRKPRSVDRERMRALILDVRNLLKEGKSVRLMTWDYWDAYVREGWDQILKEKTKGEEGK